MMVPEKMLIFIVDDDLLFQKSLVHFLSRKLKDRMQFRTFSTGEECLNALSQKPDLILLDYLLTGIPGTAMNGIEVLNRITSLHARTPVVLISGNANFETVVDAIKYGAYDFIEKKEDVYARTENLLRNVLLSVTFYGMSGNDHFWMNRTRDVSGKLNLSLKAKQRIFFSPFVLPETGKKHALHGKTKRKNRVRLVFGN